MEKKERMSGFERRNKIVELVIEKESVTPKVLSAVLGVSLETIRKDLMFLSDNGIISRHHGCATISKGYSQANTLEGTSEDTAIKMRIARKAMEYIPENATIILDSGTSTYFIAKLLSELNGYTIITNYLPIADVLMNSKNDRLLVGGKIRPSGHDLIGTWTIEALKSIQADIAFLGTDGFYKRNGPTTTSYSEVEVKKEMISNSHKSILVTNHDKFSISKGNYEFCKWNELDLIITDSKADCSIIKNMEAVVSIDVV